MKIKQLTIQGFKSYDKKQVLDFTKMKPGLYFMTGGNTVDTKLGTNGVGKTSICDALCWVCTSKTTTNIRGDNVQNWNQSSDKCVVGFNFDEFEIVRTFKPNSLKSRKIGQNFESLGQEDLELMTNLNFSSLLCSVIIPQFGPKFFDLSPEDRLRVFSTITDCDVCLTYSDRAKEKRHTVDGAIQVVKQDISRNAGVIETLRAQDFGQEIKDWEQTRKVEQKIKSAKVEAYMQDVESNNLELDKLKTGFDVCTKYITEVGRKCVSKETEIGKKDNEITEVSNKKAVLLAECMRLNTAIKRFDKLGAVCDTCDRNIDDRYYNEFLDKKEIMLKYAESEYKKQCSKYDSLDTVYTRMIKVLNSYNKEYDGYVSDRDQIVSKQGNIGILIENIESNIKNIHDDVTDLANMVNPFIERQTQVGVEIQMLEKEFKKQQQALKHVEEQYEVYNYWVQGFKDLRLFIIVDAIKDFELYVNNHLEGLGLSGWVVGLEVDSETKKKTIRRGFTVVVESPKNKGLKPFDCWSGGEGQRLRLAGTLGLIDMVNDRKVNTNVEVFDEPTQHLGETGIDDLLNVLIDRAKNLQKIIILVDHRNLDSFGGFAGVINVSKGVNGSVIIVS